MKTTSILTFLENHLLFAPVDYVPSLQVNLLPWHKIQPHLIQIQIGVNIFVLIPLCRPFSLTRNNLYRTFILYF